MTFTDADFNALLEAAADYNDYLSGRHFVRRESKPVEENIRADRAEGRSRPAAGGPESALRLRDPCALPPWATGLRRMLNAMESLEFTSTQGSPLQKLCEAGARHGWQELEATNARGVLAISRKAKRHLTTVLRHNLARATRYCLELERISFVLVVNAIGPPAKATDPKLVERKFLGEKPSDRLFSLFKKFPVLARLWFQLISQWRDHVMEILERFEADRDALSRTFFDGQPIGTTIDMHCGLSDSHKGGRTVTELQFEAGSVIYKPRPGDGEWEWASLLQKMDARSFRPKLRAARVLRRGGYCWMERIEPAACKDKMAACRFYQRIGAMIGAAYLLRAVDCHRDNVIAAGEHPVLVDAEALWHPSGDSKPLTPVDLLLRSGFLSAPDGGSLQSRSSVLAHAAVGQHVPRLGSKPLRATKYERDIINGFNRAWRCVLGTNSRRALFVRRLRRIRSLERRVIFKATEKYAVIVRASIQPAALRSGIERDLMLSRLCSRRTATSAVIHAEIAALKRLDIPYFISRINARFSPDNAGAPPAELTMALRDAL